MEMRCLRAMRRRREGEPLYRRGAQWIPLGAGGDDDDDDGDGDTRRALEGRSGF
jgi:hypothetical protein